MAMDAAAAVTPAAFQEAATGDKLFHMGKRPPLNLFWFYRAFGQALPSCPFNSSSIAQNAAANKPKSFFLAQIIFTFRFILTHIVPFF